MVNIEYRKQQRSDFLFNTKDSIKILKILIESNIKIKEISYIPIIIENLIWATAVFLAGSRLRSISFRQVSISAPAAPLTGQHTAFHVLSTDVHMYWMPIWEVELLNLGPQLQLGKSPHFSVFQTLEPMGYELNRL